jgi:hypothetical protein
MIYKIVPGRVDGEVVGHEIMGADGVRSTSWARLGGAA